MTVEAKKEALTRMREYARTAARHRLQGEMREALHWDNHIERIYSEAKRRGWSEDPFVSAEERGRASVRVARDASRRDLSGGKRTRAYEAELHAKHLAQETDVQGRGAGPTAKAYSRAADLWREAKSYERAEKLEKEAERWIAWGRKYERDPKKATRARSRRGKR